MLFLHFVSVLFLVFCCSICLYVLYLYDLIHVLLLQLQTYGSRECMCVCVCVCMYVCMYERGKELNSKLAVDSRK
jgi:hypothetical protein